MEDSKKVKRYIIHTYLPTNKVEILNTDFSLADSYMQEADKYVITYGFAVLDVGFKRTKDSFYQYVICEDRNKQFYSLEDAKILAPYLDFKTSKLHREFCESSSIPKRLLKKYWDEY